MVLKRILLVTLLLCSCLNLAAQEITGTIVGTVKDQSGAGVPKATVSILNTDTNVVVRTVITDERGDYTVPLLPIGHYTLTAEGKGFSKTTIKNIELNLNSKLTENFSLPVSGAAETISVAGDAQQVELQSATASGLISGTQIRELSMNSRNYEQLVGLVPGVSYGGSDQLYIGSTSPDGSSNRVNFAINGGRKSENFWTIDGADNVDRGANLTLLNYPSVDSIAEFKVLRGLYSAESGRGGAGQINVVTRSGTSSFHGGAYEFVRNDIFNAIKVQPLATTTPTRPALRYNDFGYNVGGPVFIPGVYNTKKDKTFFFFSQEFRRVITYDSRSIFLPTAAQLAGNFTTPVCVAYSAPIGGTCTTMGTSITTIDPTAAAYIKDIYSKAGVAPSSGTSILTSPRNVFNARQELYKFDHNFGSKLTLSGKYLKDTIPTVEPGGLFTAVFLPGVANTTTDSPGKNLTVKGTYVASPTWIVDIGYAYSYGGIISRPTGLGLKANSPDINPTLPFPVTLGRIPNLNITSLTGVSGFGPYDDFNRNHSAYGNVTKIWHAHSFKFGASYNHYNKDENFGKNNVGTFSFDNVGQPGAASSLEKAWANFLLGRAASFSQSSEDLRADILANQFEAYGQDDWRVRSNLTVSLGVRYSFFGQPFDGSNRISTFDPASYTAATAPQLFPLGSTCPPSTPACAGTIVAGTENRTGGIITGGVNSPFGSKVNHENGKNFAPRIGISWDPWGDGKTAVRTGYGIYFDAYAYSTAENTIFNNPPFVQTPILSATTLSNPGGVGIPSNLFPKAITALPNDPKAPYMQQWSLDVQHEFANNWLMDVGYYGSKGTHLPGQIDLNEVPLGAAQAAGLSNSTSSNFAPYNLLRPYKGYGPINEFTTIFGSNYNSLQTSLQKRFKGSSLISANYTWSHGLTDAQTDFITAQNAYNTRAEYGPSEFDRRHVFTANFVYELPFFKDQKSFLGYALGNWEMSGIIAINSGLPLTITTSTFDKGFQGLLGASPAGARPNLVADPNGPKTSLAWFNTAAFACNPGAPLALTCNHIAGYAADGIPGNSGRGVVRGPGYQKWDMSLFKNIPVKEAFKFQFRAEAFNIWNHTNFDTVGTNVTSSTFGRITGARDARILQLALKMYF